MTRTLVSIILLIFGILINFSLTAPEFVLESTSLFEFVDTLAIKFQNITNNTLGDKTLNEVRAFSHKMIECRYFLNEKAGKSIWKMYMLNTSYYLFTHAIKTFDGNHLIIDNEYEKYIEFIDGTLNRSTITTYLKYNKNQVRKLKDAVDMLYNMFNFTKLANIQLNNIITYLNLIDQIQCDINKSAQQWLFYQFSNVILSETKAYTVRVFQRVIRMKRNKAENEQHHHDTLNRWKNDFRRRINHYINTFSSILNNVSQLIRRCDTPIENYFELKNFPCQKCVHAEFNSYPVRVISLRKHRSNIDDNKVVVGVRLVLHLNVVHIQIQEAKLRREGQMFTDKWVPLETINYIDKYIIKSFYTKEDIQENVDFAYLDKFTMIILNDLIAPDNHVIVGASFDTYKNRFYNQKAIGLKIMVAPFNWTTGKVDVDRATWTRSKTKDYDTSIENIQVDDPLKSIKLTVVENGIAKFQMLGQNIQPYFDSQEVVTSPNFPLNGIGLFKKTVKGFGEFIAPKIYTVKITKDHVQSSVNNIFQQESGF